MNRGRKKQLPYDVVAVIADQLISKGLKPEDISARAIRDETGTGSLTTIMNHLEKWRLLGRPVAPSVTLDAETLSGVSEAVTALIEQACERVRDECRTAAAGEAIEKANLQAELHDALRVNEEIEGEREAMTADIETLKAALDSAKLLAAELEGQLKGQANVLAVLERATARTTSDDAEVRPREVVSSEQPLSPAVTDAQARAVADALTVGLAETLLKQQRPANGRGEDGDPAATTAVHDSGRATGELLEMPIVPNDAAVQANVDRENRG